MFKNHKIEQKVTFLTSDTEMATNVLSKITVNIYFSPFRFVMGLTLKYSIHYIHLQRLGKLKNDFFCIP